MKVYYSYRSLRLVLLLVVFTALFSCKANKLDRAEANAKDIAILEKLAQEDHYFIDMEAAFPFNTNATNQVLNSNVFQFNGNSPARIMIQGQGNFIEIKNDSATSYLPFFGERRLNAGSYGGINTAIQFDGTIKDYKKVLNKEKKKLIINFSAYQKGKDTDSYITTLEIFPNKKVVARVSPVYRTFIQYTGRLKPLEEDLTN